VNKVNLLLVDDIPSNLIALSAVLNRPDYNLVTAESGEEALDLLSREDFALVLLDVMMPEMDGFEVAARMKKNESTRFIPIVLVTAIAKNLNQIYKGYSVGVVDYLLKPLDPDVVRAKVAVFVELCRQRREIERQALLIRNSERAQFLEKEQAARLRAESAEKRFRDLVNALDHAIIWEAAPDLSKFTFISQRVEDMLGYPRDCWLLEPEFFMSHVHPDDRAGLTRCLDSLFAGHSDAMGERCEHRMRSADGTERWFHTGFQLEWDAQRKPLRLRGLCVDISPLKEIEQALREAIRAREEIVSNVAHDLRTPLSAASLGTKLLKQASDEEDLGEIKKHANRVKHAIEHTIRLTQNILDADRVVSGRMMIEARDEDPDHLVKEAMELMRPLAAEKSIQLHSNSDLSKILVRCERERVLQVFSNLIGNAVKFTPEHGEIWIRGENLDGSARFSVRDTGPGIAADHQPKIFRRYWQGRAKWQRGLGLGLNISKGIVEAHGGKIWVKSKEGQGSTFYFTLPITVQPAPAE
jgi:PAS domain S-box-containing protein